MRLVHTFALALFAPAVAFAQAYPAKPIRVLIPFTAGGAPDFVPRFVASLCMTTALIIWSAGVAFASGMVTAYAMFDLSPETFLNMSLVDAGDLSVGLAKCVAYGAAIPVVAGHSGLSTFGGSEGVGWATTRAVVNSSLAIIMLDMFISAAGFLVFPG